MLDSLLYASAAGDNDLLPVAPGLKKQVLLDLAEMERDLPDAVAPGKTIYLAVKVVDEVRKYFKTEIIILWEAFGATIEKGEKYSFSITTEFQRSIKKSRELSATDFYSDKPIHA